jgi:dTDP-4-dehydrorhamnose reductase
LSKKKCDVTNNKDVENVLRSNNYDFIINASAYTNVYEAEINPDIAYKVNDIAIKNITSLINKNSSVFIHFSTDYVFDGKKKAPYTEEDRTNPINEYGKSKLNGEINLKTSDLNYFIFRTSWVYDNKGNNFPNKIVNQVKHRKFIEVIDDQFGVPNHVDFISSTTLACLNKYYKYSPIQKNGSHGVYNLSCNGQTTWFSFAKYILDGIYNKSRHKYDIKAVKSNNFNSNIKRPQHSVLSNMKIIKQFDIKIPSWQYYADKYIESFDE